MATVSALKAAASSSIDGSRDELVELSGEIWRNPELANEEHKAHQLLTDFLETKGFTVERSFTGLATAFRATFGSGSPNVCVISEYDALPEIGHACGHNLIAEAGVAAGLGVKAALESSGAPQGTVTVMGTPAEEDSGGKVTLIKNGAFKNVDFAMMVHPAPVSIVMPALTGITELYITFTGKAAHAASYPWEGVNALDAAVMAYNSISVLRQQMKPSWSVHGVITNGGAKANIIPEKAAMSYYIRAIGLSEMQTLKAKVSSCFQAAALATGCEVTIEEGATSYLDLVSNPVLAKLYAGNYSELGMKYDLAGDCPGSTDMGNVSYEVPSIHPLYTIGSGKEVNHARDFTAVANTRDAHEKTLLAAKSMAHTCIDVLTSETLLKEIKEKFEN